MAGQRARMRFGCSVAFAVLGLVTAAAARSEPRRNGARLAWVRGVAADECVGQAGLEEDVKARLGHDPFALPRDLALEGAVVRVPEGFRADLVVRDAHGKLLGSRQLTSRERSCRALGEAVAVAITIAIDPNAAGSRVEKVEETETAVEPPPPHPPPPRAPPRMHGRASISAGAAAGLVPDIVPTVALRARASLTERFDLGIGAHYISEARTSGTGFALTAFSVEACAAPFAASRTVRWCGAMLGGVLHGFVHAADLSPVDDGSSLWAAAETGPALVVPLTGPLRLEVGAQAVVPITRKDVFIRGRSGALWEQAVVGARLDAGLGAEF